MIWMVHKDLTLTLQVFLIHLGWDGPDTRAMNTQLALWTIYEATRTTEQVDS